MKLVNKIKWFALVIKQELQMFKFKSIARYVYDAKYRSEINTLCEILSVGTFRATPSVMPLQNIHFSHDVSYSQWVFQLVRRITAGEQLPAIKVVLNPKTKQYMVVDGNHRLMAYKLTKQSHEGIAVRVLTRSNQIKLRVAL